ncbi:PAP2 superfamily-domain-containing protein [Tirmania nivea]|nr:PAP2 superfamily-domain-containing protein [Tirmania nivea]
MALGVVVVNAVVNATGVAVEAAGAGHDGHWNSKPAWKLPGWGEPVMVATILFLSCYLTRRRSASICSPRKELYQPLRSTSPGFVDSPDSEESTPAISRIQTPLPLPTTTSNGSHYLPTRRMLFWGLWRVNTPNTTRFRGTWLSRVLNKFPFLIEMLYWIVTYALYQTSRILSQRYFADGIWERAQANGEWILWVEHSPESPLYYFFPVTELSIQRWFMSGTWGLTLLNRCYALIHIPGTVGFIGWYYCAARSHEGFVIARRTLTLANWIAFAVFSMWPCMPPRLLPEKWGFVDTVRRDSAQSVWMGGKYVNSLSAMPSMHFAYSFIVGIVIVHWSGVLQNWALGSGGAEGHEKGLRVSVYDDEDGAMGLVEVGEDMDVDEAIRDRDRSCWKGVKMWLVALGAIAYPTLILTAIVATANHYWLDALAGAVVAAVAYSCNRMFLSFLPVEDWFMWACRAEKPAPTTGRSGKAIGVIAT